MTHSIQYLYVRASPFKANGFAYFKNIFFYGDRSHKFRCGCWYLRGLGQLFSLTLTSLISLIEVNFLFYTNSIFNVEMLILIFLFLQPLEERQTLHLWKLTKVNLYKLIWKLFYLVFPSYYFLASLFRRDTLLN